MQRAGQMGKQDAADLACSAGRFKAACGKRASRVAGGWTGKLDAAYLACSAVRFKSAFVNL